jgi:hypothetical protein
MADAKKVMLVNTKMEPGDKLIDLRKRVKVTATDKNPHAKAGTVSYVSELVAAKGKSMGYYEKK